MNDRFNALAAEAEVERTMHTEASTGRPTSCEVSLYVKLEDGITFSAYAFSDDVDRVGAEDYYLELEKQALTEVADKMRNTFAALEATS